MFPQNIENTEYNFGVLVLFAFIAIIVYKMTIKVRIINFNMSLL